MKFKKVEIQAFRAYDKAEDGTFDFARQEDGINADFISLYAPNGFGKTSFYDAVEYGITKNIHRFIKKQKFNQDSAKSEKNISTAQKQFILRNRDSDLGLEGFVKLTTTDSDNPIIRNIAIPPKGGRDFKFDEKETEKKYFKEVILSQEWIDAFLKEDKPEERYNTFIEYFGDKKIDGYYQNIVAIISLNDKRINALKKELDGIQLDLNFGGDKDILSKVNEKIATLNKTGEKLNTIEINYSETDALKLTNAISERISDLNFKIKKSNELLKYLDIFLSGDEEIEGMLKYFESKDKLEQLNKKEIENKLFLEKFDLKQNKTNELDSIVKSNKEHYSNKQTLEALILIFKEYLKTVTDINFQRQEIQKHDADRNSLTTKLSNSRETEAENGIKLNSLQSQITKIEKNITELPQLKESINITSKRLKELQIKLNETNGKIEDTNKTRNLSESIVNELKSTISKISSGIYPSVFEKEYTQYTELIVRIEEKENNLKIEKSNLLEINKKIKGQESFQKEIEQFITKGSEIINKSQTSSCPLCSQDYESYSYLAAKVSKNTLLSSLLSALLNERNEKETTIQQLVEEIKINRENLNIKITKVLTNNEKNLSNSIENNTKLSENKNVITSETESLVNKLNLLTLSLNGQTSETYEFESKKKLDVLKTELTEFTFKIENLKKLIILDSEALEIIKQKITSSLQEINILENNSSFLKIQNYFKEDHPDKKVSQEVLTVNLAKISEKLEKNNKLETKLRKEIEELAEELKAFTKESISNQLSLLEKTKELFQKIINAFTQSVNSKLNISIQDYTVDSFTQYINDRKKISQNDILNFELQIKDFNLLVQFKENVVPFLKFEKAKFKEKSTKERIDFLKNRVAKELESERNKVSSHISDQVNSFFYEGLINDLYKRIDPHPDYKRVKFKCDFNEDKPKLNVCVYQTNEDELIIPNLYFSTAQLNILSLSIFLAKALNAKDEKGNALDCIFIDDPIQSMDSINILSTIDLLRSIVVNQKKQIILSTHDENFHSLLKKKMPTNLFKSKFMELETFGKVKKEIN